MHYGGMVGDHTTASMVVSLEEDRIVVWTTGSSLPCVSLFKPWVFGTETCLPVIGEAEETGKAYWLEAESFRRSLLGKVVPKEYYDQRDALEAKWIAQAQSLSTEDFPDFSKACLQEEAEFYRKWKEYPFAQTATSGSFRKRWADKTAVLKQNHNI
jgi:hypothetical protein